MTPSLNLDIAETRALFPSLSRPENGRPRIHLDAPAGTQVPASVIQAVSDAFLDANANLGGRFTVTLRAEALVDQARAAVADLFGVENPADCVLGANMTTITLAMSRALARDWQAGDEIILSRMDHEGNVGPWLEVARDKDLTVRWLTFDRERWHLDPEELARLLSPKTRLVAFTACSNLLGTLNPVAEMTALVRAAGALSYVDCVQFAPHRRIRAAELGADLLVASSYKYFGPHLGTLWGRREVLDRIRPYKLRTVPEVTPHKFETGTAPIELFAGLTAAVDYIAGLGTRAGATGSRAERLDAGYAAMDAHESVLTDRLLRGVESLPGVTLIGPGSNNRPESRVGTVSFVHDRMDPQTLHDRLAAAEIYGWAGHFYALEVVRHAGIDEHIGVTRLGLAHYNTAEEIDTALEVLEHALRA